MWRVDPNKHFACSFWLFVTHPACKGLNPSHAEAIPQDRRLYCILSIIFWFLIFSGSAISVAGPNWIINSRTHWRAYYGDLQLAWCYPWSSALLQTSSPKLLPLKLRAVQQHLAWQETLRILSLRQKQRRANGTFERTENQEGTKQFLLYFIWSPGTQYTVEFMD